MRNPCKECDYYHKENNTCQSKKCCTGGDGYITWIDRLFCKPYKYNADRKTEPIPYDDYIESENDHLEARCLNCNNAKACKEKHWEGCVYEPKDEKTCETCKSWKYIRHEWQCETTKCQGYTPRTENSSENPNNCDTCRHYTLACDLFSEICRYEPKTEPQTERSE